MGVHGLGHNAIGGDVMNDVYASPGDPTFFLHHAMVNRDWWVWQQALPAKRTFAVGGYTTTPCEQQQQTDGCVKTGLNYTLSSLGFYPSILGKQIMNTQGNFLCYVYDY